LQWSVITGDEVVVTLVGELDMSNAPALADALATVVAERPKMVILDLAQLTFLDSSGISCLMGAAVSAADVGCEFKARLPSASVLRVMEICGLDQLLLEDASEGPAAPRR
jgi:anti-sigma B factor antagonist